jgi:hypothetical protein
MADEIEVALEAVGRAAENFLATMEGVTAEQYVTRPRPESWSLAENAEHTTVVIRGIERLFAVKLLDQPLPPNDPSRRMSDSDLHRLMADRTKAITAPERVNPKGRWTVREDMAIALRTSVSGLTSWAPGTPADLRALGAPHPFFGPLDGVQWILFLGLHTDRHARHAEEIRRAVTR